MSTIDLSVLQPVSQFAAAIGVCVAAIYYVMNLRISQRNQELNLKTQQQNLNTRHAQLMMSILNRWVSAEYGKMWQVTLWNMNWVDYDDKLRKYPWGSPEFIEEAVLWNYWESTGVLVEEGLIDAKMVSKLIAGDLIQFWEKFSPFLFEMRRRRGFPQLYDKTEYLYNEMKRLAPLWKYQPDKPF